MGSATWRRKVAIALYVVALVNVAVAVERMAFDVAGQMWLTLIINGIIALSSLVCIIGTFIRQKEAVIAFIVCAIIGCMVNVVVILVYNDVGLLGMKERYLSLGLGHSESWWKNHGIFCYRVCSGNETAAINGGGHSSGQLPRDEPVQRCFIPYTIIETFHGVVNIILTLICIVLSSVVVCKKKGSEEGDFHYFHVNSYGGNKKRSPQPMDHAKSKRKFYKQSSDLSGTLSTSESSLHEQ